MSERICKRNVKSGSSLSLVLCISFPIAIFLCGRLALDAFIRLKECPSLSPHSRKGLAIIYSRYIFFFKTFLNLYFIFSLLDRARSIMRTSTPAAMRLTWLGLFFILLGLSQTPFTSGTALTKSLAELSANCRQCTRRSEIVVPMITNSDWVLKAFWASLATGVTRANQLYNTSSVLLQPVSFSPVNEAALVAKAAQNYTLMGTTVADLANVAPAINTAVQNGTAVITFNVGDLFLAQDNAMNHIGQPESVAGAKMGGRMVALGSTNIVCIMHQIGSAGQTQRCQGANAGALAANSAVTFTTITADGSSVPSLTATVNAYLDANPTTDGIISLSQDVVNYYVTILQTRGQTNTVRLATFDVNLDIISKMASNKIAYCVDQQQVLQGFGTMLLLKTLYMTRGQKLLTKILLTGPSVVKSANSGPISCRLDNTQAGCVATLASVRFFFLCSFLCVGLTYPKI
ncbi:periplasmic binding protein-like I [Blastocladiella britannica]|nr:periplasmic binding protein-like I [Blastocladiella britannica]